MNKRKNYTFFRVLSAWSGLLAQMIRQWRVFVSYALVITLISTAFGFWSYECKSFDCKNIYLLYIKYILLYGFIVFLLGAFVVDIYKSVSENSVFKVKDVFSCLRSKIKMTATFLAILFTAIASSFIAYIIIQKPANPDFGIEFCYFLITFAFLLVPLLMIRCSACFAYYMNTGHFAASKVYDNTSGCSYISIMPFLLLVIFCLIMNLNFIRYFNSITGIYRYFVIALSMNFIGALLKLIYFAAILMLFEAQYIQMEKDEAQKITADDDADENSEETAKDEVEIQKVTNKAASKKKYKRKVQTKQKTSKKK